MTSTDIKDESEILIQSLPFFARSRLAIRGPQGVPIQFHHFALDPLDPWRSKKCALPHPRIFNSRSHLCYPNWIRPKRPTSWVNCKGQMASALGELRGPIGTHWWNQLKLSRDQVFEAPLSWMKLPRCFQHHALPVGMPSFFHSLNLLFSVTKGGYEWNFWNSWFDFYTFSLFIDLLQNLQVHIWHGSWQPWQPGLLQWAVAWLQLIHTMIELTTILVNFITTDPYRTLKVIMAGILQNLC